MKRLLLISLLLIAYSTTANAKHHHHHHHQRLKQSDHVPSNYGESHAGIVVSHKTGATARVGAAHAAAFQSYVDDLEAHGAVVRFMGGIRGGRCSSGHMHPCGRALDVCQLSRGRVDGRCNLPGPVRIAAIAAAHGLFEGAQWCSSDYGHAQVGVSAPACGTQMAARRHHRRQYASRSNNDLGENYQNPRLVVRGQDAHSDHGFNQYY